MMAHQQQKLSVGKRVRIFEGSAGTNTWPMVKNDSEGLGGMGHVSHLPLSHQAWCRGLYISGSCYTLTERICFKGVSLWLMYISEFAIVGNRSIEKTYNLKK